jgi:hypothetical protein
VGEAVRGDQCLRAVLPVIDGAGNTAACRATTTPKEGSV